MAAIQGEADRGCGPPERNGERYGPLTIDRCLKGDGRALILYAARRPQSGDSRPGEDNRAGPSS